MVEHLLSFLPAEGLVESAQRVNASVPQVFALCIGHSISAAYPDQGEEQPLDQPLHAQGRQETS